MDLTAKRKRNGLRMKHQDSASSVSRSFSLSSDFPSVACFRCRMPFERMVGRGKVFGLNTLRRRKILPETACRLTFPLPSVPCATFASEHREQVTDGMNLNYTIGCFLCHKIQTMLLSSLSWWRRFHLSQTV